MNEKAEVFQAYLNERKITAFTVEEGKDNELHAVVFRSHADISGSRLPVMIILDDSIYGMIRILVAPKVMNSGNKNAVLDLMNGFNKKYKAFKYYADDAGNIIMDTSVLCRGGNADGNMIYAVLNVIIQHLNESYKDIMKVLWQ